MAKNYQPTLERILNEAWTSLQAELEKMRGQARPKAAVDVVTFERDADGFKVNIAPVTLLLKEKAAASECVLYVTVEGWMRYPSVIDRDDLRIESYQTWVGYFREVGGASLKHVFGIHYDHDDKRPAHPVYHSQMSTMAHYVANINESWNLRYDAIPEEMDLTRGLLRNLRVPTAHMDPFSVFLQVIGDHLVSEASDHDVAEAFNRLRQSLSAIKSCRSGSERLQSVIDQRCFRGGHWYP